MKRRFDFRLARVLRVRELAERAARAEWGRAQSEVRAAADRRDAARAGLAAARSDVARGLASGPLAPERALVDQRALDAQLTALQLAGETLLTRQAQAQAQQAVWAEREQERRALDELQVRARKRHHADLRAAENAEMDEIAGLRDTRRRQLEARRETDSSRGAPTTDEEVSPGSTRARPHE